MVVVCNTVRAVSMWLMGGYSTVDFLLAFGKHSSVYGAPSLVMSDQGSQLTAAAQDLVDWDKVQQATASSGTTWRFVPPATPWRVGMAERVVGMVSLVAGLDISRRNFLGVCLVVS